MNLNIFFTNARTAELFFNLSLQIAGISLFGWLLMKIWKPKSAPLRSAGYLALMISLAALPVFTALSAVCHVSWFRSTIEISRLYETQATESFILDSQIRESINENDDYMRGISSEQSDEIHNGFLRPDRILTAMNAFGTIWISGFLFSIFRISFKFSFLHGFLQNLSPGNNERLDGLYDTIKHVFKNRPRPQIYFSASLSSPVTIGIVRTKVILPQKIVAMSDDDIKSVLLHELAHVFHRDNFIGLLQHVVTSLFWWNPIIYFIKAAYSDSREDVCDNYAINVLKSPKRYAKTLINLAGKTCLLSGMPTATGMSVQRRSLEHRVLDLLRRDRDLTTGTKPSLVVLLLMVSLSVVSCGPGLRVSLQDTRSSMGITESVEDGREPDRYRFPLAPGGNWKLRQAFNSSDAVFSLPYSSALICMSRRADKGEKDSIHLSFLYRRWLYNIKGKYSWKHIRIITEGDAVINKHVAYYAILEYTANNIPRKDKVYFFRDINSTYLLRYSGTRDAYDGNVSSFEEYVKSFETVL
jgi:beta-lactamase regulating signal transducer with metallopeptidase domain